MKSSEPISRIGSSSSSSESQAVSRSPSSDVLAEAKLHEPTPVPLTSDETPTGIFASAEDFVSRALAHERLANARRINTIRFVGVSFFFALFLCLAGVLDLRTWQGNLHYFVPYWLVTAGLFLASRRYATAARTATWAIAFVDMPMVFLLQWATFPTTPDPAAVAGYTMGVYVLLLIIEGLSLDTGKIYLTAAVGACCEGLLQYLAGVEVGAIICSFLIMGIAALACAYGSRRITELIRRVILDVSERRRAEGAVRARDEFLSIASHELKTPLTSLLLAVQGLLREVRKARDGEIPRDKLVSRLESADVQTQRLEALINHLLDVSAISSGRLELTIEEVDAAALVKEVLEQSADALAKARCTVTVAAAAPVVGAWDRLRLEQVVTNLLGNAMKYGAGKPIEITVTGTAGEGLIVCRDHGIGISAEDQKRLFRRFERATAVRNYGGLGLGLWISRQIVENLGGSLEVESRAGEGATFTVRLQRDGVGVRSAG